MWGWWGRGAWHCFGSGSELCSDPPRFDGCRDAELFSYFNYFLFHSLELGHLIGYHKILRHKMKDRICTVNNRIRIRLTAGTDPKHSYLGTGTVLEATARETSAQVWIRTSTQCCGSGSGLPDHSGSLIIFYGSGSFHHQTKKVRKPLISLFLLFIFED